jgi:hypothetical protein
MTLYFAPCASFRNNKDGTSFMAKNGDNTSFQFLPKNLRKFNQHS